MGLSNEVKRLRWFALALTMLGQGALTLCIPAFPALAHGLHAGNESVKFSLTLFLLAYGLSQLFYGPASDVYGRKKVLMIGLAIMFVGSIMTPFCHQLMQFDIARILQGLGAGATMVIIRASLRDVSSGHEYSKSMAYLSIGFAVGLGLFPMFGGFLSGWFGWQAVFVFLTVVVFATLLSVLLLFPETNPADASMKKFKLMDYTRHVTQQYATVLRSGIFWLFFCGGMSVYAVVVIYNVMTPFLIQQHIGLTAQAYGMLSLVVAFPYWLGAVCNTKLLARLKARFMMLSGVVIIVVSSVAMFIIGLLTHHLNIYALLIPFCFAIFGQ